VAEDTQSRRLTTIVALDVAGYSARTEADEVRSAAEVAALRGIVEEIAALRGGRLFSSAGDGFMLEFGSSLAAVEAALALAKRCEPKVRIGVHLGDVAVQPNGDLLGHGVNVAARLMARSDPGSALVSADVRRTIRGPLAERLVSRGILQLDKMAETIEAFALAAAGSAVVAAPSMSRELLLAVLPFDNLSDDREMQFFSDGVSEEIIQRVSRGARMKVIGRTSSFQFRGADKTARKVANELKCTHILDGSIRRAGGRIRIAAHLLEAVSQTILWSDRYDRHLEDIFAVQDDISENIAAALHQTFSSIEPHPHDGKSRVFGGPLCAYGRLSACIVPLGHNFLERPVQRTHSITTSSERHCSPWTSCEPSATFSRARRVRRSASMRIPISGIASPASVHSGTNSSGWASLSYPSCTSRSAS